MLIPINTDAPIYHYPVVTVGLIVVNVLVFAATLNMDESDEDIEIFVPPLVAVIGPLPEDFDDRLTEDLDYYIYENEFEFEDAEAPEEVQTALENNEEVTYFVLLDDDRLVDPMQWKSDLIDELISEYSLPGGSLRYGEFNPIQWVTSNFVHGGFLHLLGNMFFLWGFGLVIEGKLGWWKFLLLYLTIGAIECALEQSIMFWAPGGSFGASSVLFGMMAIACIWAPRNNMTVVLWIAIRPWMFEMPIYGFALAYLLMQFAFMGLSVMASGDASAALGSEFLHLLGMIVAVPIGLAMLKYDMVDCEGWDIFSVAKGTNRARLSGERRQESVDLQQQMELHIQEPKPLATLQQMLADGLQEPAIKLWRKHAGPKGTAWALPEEDHKKLAQAALAAKEWETAMQLLAQWIERGFAAPPLVRIHLAELLCKIAERPSKALAALEPLDPTELPDKQRQRYHRVKAHAQKMLDEGHLELAADE